MKSGIPHKKKLNLTILATTLVVPVQALSQEATLGHVITSASRTERDVNDVPVAAFVIHQDDIKKRNLGSLEEIVDRTPGVTVQRNKGMTDSAPSIILRGVPSSKRSLIMVDGVPINDGYAGSQKMMGLAPESIESVEIVLGPSSSLYGNNAMGGLVSYNTRMPERQEFRYAIGYGDSASGDRALNQLIRTYFSYGNSFSSGWKLFASASYQSTDGAVQDLVTRATAPAGVSGYSLMRTTSGGMSYVIGDKGKAPAQLGEIALRGEYSLGGLDRLRFSVNRGFQSVDNSMPNTYMTLNATGASTFTPAGTTFSSFIGIQQNTERKFLSVGLDKKVGNSMIKAKVAKSITDYWYLTSWNAAATWGGGAAQKVYNPSEMIFADIQVNTPLGASHVLTWGATYQLDQAQAFRYDLTSWRNVSGLSTYQDEFRGVTTTLGFFLQDEWTLGPKTTAFLGLRSDRWEGSDGYAYVRGNAALNGLRYDPRRAGAVSPRIGVNHKLNSDVTLRASLGTAFRAANVFDLYRPFPTSTATGTYTGNNPMLKPETLKSIDFGGDAKLWTGGALKATVYYNRFADMVYNKPITTLAEANTICPGIVALNFNTPAGQKCVQKTNVGAAMSKGVELMLTQRIGHEWSGYLGLTTMSSRIVSNASNPASEGKQFTLVPHKTASAGIEYRTNDWTAGLNGKYVGRSWGSSDDTNSQTTWGVLNSYNAYTMWDMKVSYKWDKKTTLSFAIDNLMNKDVISYNPLYKRSWFAQVSGEF